MEYGYARISTREQHEDRQIIALTECGVDEKNIFLDKQSGKDFNRPQYQRLMKKLTSGDTLFVKSIDRLGRNYEDIKENWRILTKDRNVSVVVLDMPLLDTREKKRDLTGIFIADLVLQILSYIAHTEREFLCQRQAEGIAAARARGVHIGRPPIQRPEGFKDLREAWLNKAISGRLAAKKLGVAPRTFRTWACEGLTSC